jgi:dihydroorotate dehydrogenase electron transfer subunit
MLDVDAEVLRNTQLSNDYNVVALQAPVIAERVRPGQFVMLKPGAAYEPLLRRPFSVFEILRDDRGTPTGITILNKRIGLGTSLLYELVAGNRLPCLGPLGRPFSLPPPEIDAWLVAGGVGLGPFATMTEALAAQGTKTTLFYGARRAEDLHYADWFAARGVEVVTATEDGSAGARGFITVPLEDRLTSIASARGVAIYACGPTPMMRAVATLASRFGRDIEVSLEQTMGCGLGGCYSCVVRVKQDGRAPHFVRSCIAGPVFRAGEIVWEELALHP